MTTLLVDNYDSYTYNVFQLLAAASGEEPIVVQNDMVSWTALSRWDFDAIVLSPGPGRPERWHDFGVCADILRSSPVPVLGVCLGHQGLGHLLNADVTTAPVAMHGRLSRVGHTGSGLFEGIPQDFSVVRYHSLAVTGDLGAAGRVIAWTDDHVPIVMGIEHTLRPIWGVQFHPESIATEHGLKLFQNFYALAQTHRSSSSGRTTPHTPLLPPAQPPHLRDPNAPDLHLYVRTMDGQPATDVLFDRLFGACAYAFCLDSADAPTGLAQSSFLGATLGPHRCVLEYDVERGLVTSHRAAFTTTEPASIFDVLERETAKNAVEDLPAELPRGLLGGFVGYLGYECKADCGSPNNHRSELPDAVLMLANRLVTIDHLTGRTHLIALCHDDERDDVEAWLDAAELAFYEVLAEPPGNVPLGDSGTFDDPPAFDQPIVFRLGRGREQYLADIARCQAELAAGESYEVCLTDQFHTHSTPDPSYLYRTLRTSNPAPFSAYLKLGDCAIVSSSPERFLSIDPDRRVQARPIKGTAPRSEDPVADEAARTSLLDDEKTFAEHLMIVDLLRNDLGRVCELGTVHVPHFMTVEPYATVHQLVSTITGTLQADRTPIGAVRACFPGGSMTGAPKLRTMELIDEIEREARGVYSGALGYFGLDGSVDLSIVIRTVVIGPTGTSIGAGGAIVMQSDPQEEFEEVLLKARAPMAAIAEVLSGSGAPGAYTLELEPSTSSSSSSRARA